MSIETGGPAFPEIFTDHKWDKKHSDYMQDTYSTGGMTLRDYFAAKALQGLISLGGGGHNMESIREETSKISFGYADAMIKERNKPC